MTEENQYIEGDIENIGEANVGDATRDTDRSTVWYTIGTGDTRILRTVLMDQDRETLEKWRTEAGQLQSEIWRIFAWMGAEEDHES